MKTLLLTVAFLALTGLAPTALSPRTSLPADSAPVQATAASPERSIAQILPAVTSPVIDWSDYAPTAITVSPEPDLPLEFHVVRVTRENGITTWIGRNALRGASLVAIGKRDSWHAVLSLIGGTYDIHVTAEGATITERSAPLSCPTTNDSAHAALLHSEETHAAAVPTTGNPAIHTSGTTIYTVETAFYYTQDLEQALLAGTFDGTAIVKFSTPAAIRDYLDSRFRAYLETNNLILEQSQVSNLRWHFAGMTRLPDYPPQVYDHNGDNGAARYNMNFDLGQLNDPTDFYGNGIGRFVAAKDAELFADQSILIVPDNRNYGGLASFAGHHCVVSFTGSNLTVAHEMGHNFGLYHDRETDAALAHDGDGIYAYGYLFHYDPTKFGGTPYDYKPGDVMSYGGPVLPFYSNPNVVLRGNDFASGAITQSDDNLYPLGIPANQPKAAHAARTLQEGAAAMANHRNDPSQTFPAISIQPLAAATITPGAQLRLTATASGTNLSYQWRKNGANIVSATSATYAKPNAAADDAGVYDVVITNPLGSVISRASTVNYSTVTPNARLVNISTRSLVGTGDNVQIAGFVITGDSPKTVLVRAGSAVLTAAGLTGVLADPTIELHDSKATIATNDNWSADGTTADAIRTAAAQVGAAAWTTGSKDAAILITLNPGLYSAVVKGKGETTGTAIVEVYEVSEEKSRVVNISTRSLVGTGDNVQIAGFVITGDSPKTVLVRAGSAVLTAAGLTGVLADPTIELHDSKATIATNDDWSTDTATADAIRATAAQVGAATWTTGSKDAAILITLNPGLYSALVKGKAANTGAAIVEVYDATP